eukprot:Blabericola_migrator_1__7589@NODE_387_length_9104_cov_64_864336_g310_i0_p6_GENE_NODE_387_length_9104_cov_64_864336_g310_i0NODE_387_length_9104_cov_64_864336_g310_i0_p6_ORF_typecomplete_len151_score9_15DUF3482/PF11981_8/0_49_NODE_387_length_9104_cov_64_864336_g310_i043654817
MSPTKRALHFRWIAPDEQIYQRRLYLATMHPWEGITQPTGKVYKDAGMSDSLTVLQSTTPTEQAAEAAEAIVYSSSDSLWRMLSRVGPPVTGVWGAVKVGIGLGIATTGHALVGGAVIGYGLGAMAAAILWRQQAPSDQSGVQGEITAGE